MNPRVLIVGAGPAGLAAALELHRQGVKDVLVIDRDDEPGGLPRFCHHPGFGWEYTHRILTGPGFAALMRQRLKETGIKCLTGTTLVALEHGPVCTVTGPETGYARLSPQSVIIATGIRESNRGNLMVPGVRPPQGILTTGLLQQLVTRKAGLPPTLRKIVIAGTEHVSFSAVLTAWRAGVKTVAMLEEDARIRSYRAAGWMARAGGIEILTRARLITLNGTSRNLTSVTMGVQEKLREIPCDGIVFTANWIPEIAALTDSHLQMDAQAKGPAIDSFMRASLPGVFACGNVLRGVETSGWAAMEGRRAGNMAALALKGALPAKTKETPLLRFIAAPGIKYRRRQFREIYPT